MYADLVEAVDATEEFGGIDVMVNNAGIVHPVEFFNTTDDDFEKLIGVNLKGAYFGCQAAGERMVENGGGPLSTSQVPPPNKDSLSRVRSSIARRKAE